VEAAFAAATAANGEVEILVNNAGVAGSAPFHRMDSAHWRQLIDTNLTGNFLCARQVYPAMRKAGWGRIVNIASTAGLKGYPYIAAYTASKHGAIGLTRALALEAARTGVTVNAVCPGYTETDIVRGTIDNIVAKTGRSADEALGELTAHNPQARLIQPWEVAETVAWLCLAAADSITGQSIAVAGGEVM
jgi:NAD(P)-dependent dehydrogenase (short-subunit alcohol dehydrogenase family)